MAKTVKNLSDRDYQQTFRLAFNDVDATITTNGFLVGKVGRKVEAVISTTSVPNDTVTYTFSEDGVNLYAYEIIYTSAARTQMISAERVL